MNTHCLLVRTACIILLAAASSAFATQAQAPLTAAQFREDVAFVRETIAAVHPDVSFSADPGAVQAALDRVAKNLPPTLSRDEAWRRLASLNPLFADAHFFIGYPDWRGDTRAWLAAGGTLFPAEVEVRPDGRLFLRGELPGTAPTHIVSVNEVNAEVLVLSLLAHVHGDTPAFRVNLLARRWWFFYWKIFGAPEHYRLVLEEVGRRRAVDLPGSRTVPRVLRDEDDFGRQFSLAIQPGGKAVLTVGTFSLADPAPFHAFTRDAFARIREAGVSALEIDISRNGGGDDAMWLDGLMPYLATRPYRTGSSYRGRASAQTATPGKRIEGDIATWRQPQKDHPLRYNGKLSVRIGPDTYSSAVLFANVMRDFGMATLVGTGGAARRSQSGDSRSFRLPHTGLVIWLPRFILDPPGGRSAEVLLQSDMAASPESNTQATH